VIALVRPAARSPNAKKYLAAGPSSGWSCSVSTRLSGGPHTITLRAVDPAGNTSPDGTSAFTVDLSVPSTPVLTAPATGAYVNDSTPAYTGTGQPSAVVTVEVDGVLACTAPVAVNGSWSCTQPTPLSGGNYLLSLFATNLAGTSSPPGNSNFNVDLVEPAVPTLASIGLNGFTPDSTPRFNGTAEPGSTVDVAVDGTQVCTALTAPDGTWFCDSGVVLADGSRSASAVSTDAAGNVSLPAVGLFVVDTQAPAPPVVSYPPTSGGIITTPRPTFQGTAEPGTTIRVAIDGSPACTAVTDGAGAWMCTAPAALPEGVHVFTVTQVDRAGNAGVVVNGSFDLQTENASYQPPPSGQEMGMSTNNAWVQGTASPGITVNIYVDGVLVGTAVADASGQWRFALPLMPAGEHMLEVGAVDEGGREVSRSAPIPMTIRNPDLSFGGGTGCSSTGGTEPLFAAALILVAWLSRRQRCAT